MRSEMIQGDAQITPVQSEPTNATSAHRRRTPEAAVHLHVPSLDRSTSTSGGDLWIPSGRRVTPVLIEPGHGTVYPDAIARLA
jgi:hypothetical protein